MMQPAFAEDHQEAVVTKGFLLNRMSRCFHGVVSIGGEHRRACAPLRELEPRRWVFLEQDPCEQDGSAVWPHSLRKARRNCVREPSLSRLFVGSRGSGACVFADDRGSTDAHLLRGFLRRGTF